MEMPRPLEEHKRLKTLAGTWEGEETLHPSPWDPKGGTAHGRIESRLDIDGFFLITDYTQTRGGQVSYRGHGVLGYDRKESAYTMFWFDSMGDAPPTPARGRWDGQRLVYLQETPMGHSRYTYEIQDERHYRFLIENSQDGRSWRTFMDARYTKA